jgi:hypothetical protein
MTTSWLSPLWREMMKIDRWHEHRCIRRNSGMVTLSCQALFLFILTEVNFSHKSHRMLFTFPASFCAEHRGSLSSIGEKNSDFGLCSWYCKFWPLQIKLIDISWSKYPRTLRDISIYWNLQCFIHDHYFYNF